MSVWLLDVFTVEMPNTVSCTVARRSGEYYATHPVLKVLAGESKVAEKVRKECSTNTSKWFWKVNTVHKRDRLLEPLSAQTQS